MEKLSYSMIQAIAWCNIFVNICMLAKDNLDIFHGHFVSMIFILCICSIVRQISTNGGNATTVGSSLSGRMNDIHSYGGTFSGKVAIVIFTSIH